MSEVEGLEVRVDHDKREVVLDVTSDRVDFAGLVFTEDEARIIGTQLKVGANMLKLGLK